MLENYKNLSIEDIQGEIWKDIKGYEGLYQVSNMGRIKSLNYRRSNKNKIMIQHSCNGYLRIVLTNNSIESTKMVHRLVAEAFIPNPLNKPCIDHIDTVRSNNNVSNLKWCTNEENMNNPITKERHRKAITNNCKNNIKKAQESNKKKVKCINTGELFDSAKEAAIYYNIKNKQAVSDAANPKKKNHKYAGTLPDGTKLEWKYIDD